MKRMQAMILMMSGLILLAGFAMVNPADRSAATDEQEILGHIHSIFKAYMEADEATIEATHSEDWTGFNSRSQSIVHGIDGYMANARRALASSRIVRYELEDTDVQIHGDMGIVYYVANWTIKLNESGEKYRIHARSVDVYQKRSGDWIQIGSNLNILNRPGAAAKAECGPCFMVDPEE